MAQITQEMWQSFLDQLSVNKIKFTPYRGTNRSIELLPYVDGAIYFAYDTGAIFMDKAVEENGTTTVKRYSMGGAGGAGNLGFVYASGSLNADTLVKLDPDVDNITNPYYYLYRGAFDESMLSFPSVDTLIINSNGWFFRVTEIQGTENRVLAKLISTGSTSGGGGGGESSIDLFLEMGSGWGSGTTYIYGQDYELTFTGTATRDTEISYYITIIDEANHVTISDGTERISWTSGVPYVFHTNTLPESSRLSIQIKLQSENSQMFKNQMPSRTYDNLKVVRMELQKVNQNEYYPLKMPTEQSQNINLQYIPIGDASLETTLHVYIDGLEQPSLNKILKVQGALNPYGNRNMLDIPQQGHGTHQIELQLGLNVNNTERLSNKLLYEYAWAEDGNNSPIVWIGNYDSTIINYENSYIEYMVYDPVQGTTLPAEVSLYKDGQLISEVSLNYSISGWAEWDISNAYELGVNSFTIACRGTSKTVNIFVTNDGARDLSLFQPSSLLVNYTTAGRSNLEIKSKRNIWSNTITSSQYKEATLTGFNWQSNGWKKDSVVEGEIDSGTYLSLTNGASVSIPCGPLTLNSTLDYTIEIRFRVRNIQKYSTLVQNLPLYYYENDEYIQVEEGSEIDNSVNYYVKRDNVEIYDRVIISEFEQGVTYYTRNSLGQAAEPQTMAWITTNNKVLVYDEYGSPLMDEENVRKTYQTQDGVICKWLDGSNTYGLVLGSQEAYFRSSRNSVNVRYKEDEVINISVVVSRQNDDHMVYIYLNGILSGANALPPVDQGSIQINSPFVFNSDYCDIDLYKFRIYQNRLTMPDVIHNYLSDIHSITLYDQNQLTTPQDPTQISYPLLVNYNETHPEALTMPYVVWKIVSRQDEKLPWKKGDNQMAKVTFVNPSLDKALEDGEIDEYTYYTSCPSFEAIGVDINVQGTSSQGYPRRNYKTKFKSATPSESNPDYYWIYTKGSLAGQLISDSHTVLDDKGNEKTISKNYHMDNKTYGTNKFTWKIDYMESSGTYNTGFANLMGNGKHPLYTKHPLDDIFGENYGVNMRTTIYGFPVLTFHEYENAANNPSNATSKYEYIGRYNFNLDKSSNEYYGFEDKHENPYITLTKTVVNEETNEEETVSYHPAIKDIAECWELEDNQGTWCSFKFPTEEARRLGFRTPQGNTVPDSDRLEMFRHFEYRYSPYGDQLDAIGADGKYDGTTTKQAIINQIGTTDQEKSNYAYNVYRNLEVLFKWLDSTDATSATNNTLDPPVEYITRINYMICLVQQEGRDKEGNPITITEQWFCNSSQEPLIEVGNENITEDANGYYVYMEDDVNVLTQAIAANNYEGLTIPKGGVKVTYHTDSSAYRLDKFRNEFDKHLDREYCLVYFILTELLLCYDSRGKNMMLSSYGPIERNGEYIWYPMFYDIDTQLGLNNSGAYLWDYDADVTEDGLFSTPSSVLWVNFYTVFKEEIKNKYRVLRGVDDDTIVHGSLQYENIAGAYECNPTVFDSYAMRGIRPIIAIGLDEYYKYFATTTSGYFDTSGTKIVESEPQYAYACQGDKKLTTELLLRNRLNYIDSWWLGGAYEISSVKQGQFWGRVNGNRFEKTSDSFLDLSTAEIAAQQDPKYGPDKFVHGDYPVRYLDAQPGFKLKPFLKQYVSYFTDENPSTPQKYIASQEQADGVWTGAADSIIATYKNTAEMPNEQLTYIPGVDYLSSLGDLSTSYFSEFTLTAGKRLLDLTLGSDHPDYKNKLIGTGKKFDISDGASSNTKKSLLKKIILTGLTDFDITLDISGSEKLEEFRALRTSLPDVYFADGIPLHTAHFPNTLKSLKLIETNELTNILTSAPVVATLVNNELVYADPSTYRGLYIQGVTDISSQSTGHSLYSLIIEGGGLGYGSYTILKNLVTLKTGASSNNTLRVNLKDVYWCPYEQVVYGESRVNGVNYYELTDHNTFIPYTKNSQEDWVSDTLNGIVYTYNSNMDKSTITNTELFDNFITLYNNHSQQFRSFSEELYSVPTITGTVFIANGNGTAIDEESLTNYYRVYYPNLTIYAENVNTKNITKYVNVLESGRTEVVDIVRTSEDHPQILQKQNPSKINHDFYGWAFDPEGNHMFLTYNKITQEYNDLQDTLSSYSFTQNNTDSLTLYAIFGYEQYTMSFYNKDQTLIDEVLNTYSLTDGITPTAIIPSYTPNNLDFYEVYKWLGWVRCNVIVDENTGVKNFIITDNSTVDLSTLHPVRNMQFIAKYTDEPVSVYDNVLDIKYLNYEATTGGYAIGLKDEYVYDGKITLPTVINGQPVVQAGNDFILFGNRSGARTARAAGYGTIRYNSEDLASGGSKITHIFWADPPSEENSSSTRALTTIWNSAFADMPELTYFEQVNTCTSIRSRAFQNDSKLGVNNPSIFKEILEPVTELGTAIFDRTQASEIILPGHIYNRRLESQGSPFSGLQETARLQIGELGDACDWENMVSTFLSGYSPLFPDLYGLYGGQGGQLIIYTSNGQTPQGLITGNESGLDIYGYFFTPDTDQALGGITVTIMPA